MERFLVDFEFSTVDGRVYWMPIGIQAANINVAAEIATRLHHGLAEKYIVERWGPFPPGEYREELLLEFRRSRRVGKPEILEVNEFRFRNVPFDPELSFDDHLDLETLQAGQVLPGDQTIIASMKHRKLAVRLVSEGEIKRFGEILVINVIMPSTRQLEAARDIPAESKALGSTTGRYFKATIYETPDGTVAAGVLIESGATQLQLDRDQMNTKIHDEAVKLTGKPPAFYTTKIR
jgi:hypothetical protein